MTDKHKPDTRVIIVKNSATFSTSVVKEARITLPRLPWEPKLEVKGEAA